MNFIYLYDVGIRLLLAYFLWKLYQDFRAYKIQKDKEYKFLKNRIIAAYKLSDMHNESLRDMFEEHAKKGDISLKSIIDALNELGYKNIIFEKDNQFTEDYRRKLNEHLNKEKIQLINIISDWEIK